MFIRAQFWDSWFGNMLVNSASLIHELNLHQLKREDALIFRIYNFNRHTTSFSFRVYGEILI
jgi:hypothetical protein